MNDFVGMEELMQDFLTDASDLLSDVDSKLMGLGKSPHDRDLLNVIFRSFHTIKGGAGFLNATELVTLCHLTENLFDKLRNGELILNTELMGVIFAATREVRQMFGALEQGSQPAAAPAHLIAALHAALKGEATASQAAASQPAATADGPDWNVLYQALVGPGISAAPAPVQAAAPVAKPASASTVAPPGLSSPGRRTEDIPGQEPHPGRRESEAAEDNTIRVDTDRLDQVINLSGEIGLAKNRLTHLRSDILQGNSEALTLRALDQSVSQLDMLVVNLQNAVMKTRTQPIGRLFNKYPRLARDLARQLGKDVELVLSGEETEIDNTMVDGLDGSLMHLIRNAVGHGVEGQEQRVAAGKLARGLVRLDACQRGGHILVSVSDDGSGMYPGVIRNKAIEKGLISAASASSLDDEQILNLVFLPGFSTKDQISGAPGHGGMGAVKANIQKLKGAISIASGPGKGSKFTISLPLNLAILPVLFLRLCHQQVAVPLSLVREVLHISPGKLQQVAGKPVMVVRGEVLPVLSLARLIGWEQTEMAEEMGVLMQLGSNSCILSVDSFAGHGDVVIKSPDTFYPKGVAGVTMSSEGEAVLILDIKELLGEVRGRGSYNPKFEKMPCCPASAF